MALKIITLVSSMGEPGESQDVRQLWIEKHYILSEKLNIISNIIQRWVKYTVTTNHPLMGFFFYSSMTKTTIQRGKQEQEIQSESPLKRPSKK